MHRSRLSNVVVDCSQAGFEPDTRFWAEALGRPLMPRNERYATLKGRVGGEAGVLIGFQNPWCSHYRLTNRRVVVENPFGAEVKSVSLDRFDAIDIVVQPGQAWFKAGDLVFRLGPIETFRLAAVPRPETFRQTCLKANMSFVGIKKLREAGVAV